MILGGERGVGPERAYEQRTMKTGRCVEREGAISGENRRASLAVQLAETFIHCQ
jgi:hypothetical protein